MDELPLRRACKHGRYDHHAKDDNGYWVWCSGGVDVVPNYEAATKAYYESHDTGGDHVRAVVDAALMEEQT